MLNDNYLLYAENVTFFDVVLRRTPLKIDANR